MTRPFRKLCRIAPMHALRDDKGSAAVEFALIAPVFILLLAGILEIGMVMRARFDLVSVVSAAANHALNIGDAVDDDTGDQVAGTLAALVDGNGRSATVRVNNAVTAELEDGIVTLESSGSDMADCYCPSLAGGVLMWGESHACDAICDDGSVAGRFVEIDARAPYAPFLGTYGLITSETLHSASVVRLP